MKIWYDVSDLVGWKFPHLTGIQRTSVGILNGLTDAGAAVGLVRYEPKAGRFVTLHATSLPQTVRMHLRAPASDDPVAAPHAAQETTQVVEKAVSKPPAGGKGPRRKRLKIKRLFGSDRQSEEVRQAFRQFRLASRQLRKSVGDWAASRWSRSRRAADASMPPVTMRSPILTTDTSMEATAFAAPGDVLLSVGATWCLPGYAEATAVARSRGVQIVRMVYDLIPTIKPQWLDPSHTRAITLWVRELLSSSDRVLTISEFSRQEIERYCQECRFETPPLTVVRLGDVMGDGAAAATPAASPRFVPTRPFFVCVSTLDVRKNHRLLYDAWTHLAARRGEDCPDLVCIGLPHLYVADLLREIGQDRSVNRHIHVLHGIEDSELDWYYKHCQSTIYPSKYEGWGLPVAESLGHGRMCLASNASSIPEISSDLPEFFDPFDVHGLVTLVERVLDDPAWVQHREETIRTEFRPTAWRETAAQVLAAIDAPAGRVRLEVWPRSGQEADTVRQHGVGRVLLDCTQTISTPRHAGIPRVVRNIARHGAAAAAAHGAVLVPVRFEEDRFVALGMSSAGDLIDSSKPAAPPCHPLLRRLHKLFVPRTIVRAVRTLWRKLSRRTLPGERIEFQPGDTLLLADSSWTSRCWQVVDKARSAGTRLGVVQYDFIPHTHPELMPKRLPATFRDWMTNTLARADFVAAISEAVAVEAREELRRMGRDPERASPTVQSFRLGADVKPAIKVEAPRPELAAFIAAGPCGPYLTVGTLEPRKNQALLMDVFERVWQQVPEARLLVAGFVGWKGDEVVRRMRQHPRYGTHLMHFADLSDGELLYAYGQARGLVFPSRAEGYGLPIVEALAHELRVFASDIPAHREVGGPWCVYFPPTDAGALAEKIIRFEREGIFQAVKPEGDFQSPTWRQAVDQLMAIALASPDVNAQRQESGRMAA